MRKLILLLLVLSNIFLSACDLYAFSRPTVQDGTFWLSEDSQMYISIDRDLRWSNIGKLIVDEQSGEFVEIAMGFDYGKGVEVRDHAEIVSRGHGFNPSNARLFSGNCTFSETHFTITVTRSEIDSIAVGDVIVFNRVDELPEWAAIEVLHPTEQNGTFWVSQDPQMYLQIDHDFNSRRRNTGRRFFSEQSEESVEIIMDFDTRVVEMCDIFRESDDSSNISEIRIFRGTYTFTQMRFTITVTRSEIDSIAVGDVIVFNRVDELPEWAAGKRRSHD